ncbi:MAG: potassium transporter [Acidiferrobacteraceae bacterium]|nr:potassium transporter [Acidiferrobacteraceae bacterium]|tara:strand:- start:63413 stop:64864 length:1452 start_codon:yes stop_codon:yes gene_type:complete
MHPLVIMKIMGILLSFFSISLLPPATVSLLTNDGNEGPFLLAFTFTVATGFGLWFFARRSQKELRIRDGFVIVVLFWTVLASFGSLPFLFSSNPTMSITDAFFESMSGLTTTGATVLDQIDTLPISILYYRQQLQWLGGMGIIVLAVAVMPMLGIGGMQLYRAETPGPMKDTKLTPRIKETAKALWYIYLGLTIVCALSYWLAGMNIFDAISHSFSTVSIGGFSTHDQSIGYFNNRAIYAVTTIFMIVSGINFSLHFLAWRSRRISTYKNDSEVRAFILILIILTIVTLTVLILTDTFERTSDAFWHGIFQVVSIATTTGFTTSGYHWWPTFLPAMLVLASAIGGCAGSTAGGMKVIRGILLYKQGRRQIELLIHPKALIPIKLGGKPVSEQVLESVWGFLALYVFSYIVLGLSMTATGVDLVTAFSAVTACLNNLGPGLGSVAETYSNLTNSGKWILCSAMLMGRLELYTLLVLLTPAFWRH